MSDNHFTSYDHQRSFSNSRAAPPPPPPPPPPPLPPQPQSRKAVFARLAGPFIGASRPPSSSGERPIPSGLSYKTSSTQLPSPAAPQLTARNASYNLNLPIVAISAHSDGDKAVVAGREILRILRITNDGILELANLRLPGEQRKLPQFDVKWGTAPQKNTIATAGTNGVICLYDTEVGRLDRTLKEHGRQVHKLAFNLANGHLLLSASQDGTIKLWDLRERRSRLTFQGKSDAVRDVQFNAANAVEFAAAFDNGTVQRWDYRKENIYERKINAHNGPAFTVDWHPDGKHCASGGRDRTVKVWDFYADARTKPKHTISTMSSIAKVMWRPMNSRYAYNQSTELATIAINNDNRIHLWDLKRPHIPSRVMEEHTGLPTGILWRDEDVLWSCSKDGTFIQNDVQFASQPVENLAHAAFAWAPGGEFTFAAQRRGKGRTRRGHGSRVTFDLDEDISMRDERRRHSHSGSTSRPKPTLKQDSVLETTIEKYTPAQTCARVEFPILFDKEAFAFFAERYVIDLTGIAGGNSIALADACEINALVAWKAQKYDTAQSWRIIRHAVVAEDAAEDAERRRRPQSLAPCAAGIVAWRALGMPTGDPSVASNSGGATPLAGPLPGGPVHGGSPLSMKPTTPQDINTREQAQEYTHTLNLPPKTFGNSISSSTASTDGDDTSPEARLARDKTLESSDEDSALDTQKSDLPNLTVDTSLIQTCIRNNENNPSNPSGNPQIAPVDGSQNRYLPFFTASTERPEPLAYDPSPTAFEKPSTPPAATTAPKPTPLSTQPQPFNAPDSFNANSPHIARQLSIVSELTSSSYNGVPGSITTEDSPPSPPLAAITEEHFSPAVIPAIPHLNIQSSPTPHRPNSPPQEAPPPPPWSVVSLTQNLLSHLTETGDLQFASTLILLLSSRVKITPSISQDILQTYTAHLTRIIDRPDIAAQVRKVAGLDEGMWNVAVDLSCGVCGRAVGGRGGGWCSDCGASGCVICGVLGKGRRWTVCASCGHGGCDTCVGEWFLGGGEVGECAAVGCACVCLPR